MATHGNTHGNTDPSAEAHWLSISDLARQRGVGKAVISRQVARLEQNGALRTRVGPHGAKLVNQLDYQNATAKLVDSPQARARRAVYAAETLHLDLDQQMGAVLSTFVDAWIFRRIAAAIEKIERLPSRSETIAAAAAKGGPAAVSAILATIAYELRRDLEAQTPAGVSECAASTTYKAVKS